MGTPTNDPRQRLHAFTDDALGADDATALAERIRRGDVSATDAAEAAIERIGRVDPVLQAVAWEAWDRARGEAARPGRGAFAGVPTLIKDNIDVAGLPSGHGARAVRPGPADKDSDFARQFLDQGFTLIGKSRLPDFGFSASTEFMDQPPTRNPWHTDYSSGASSGGAAALVAAGALPIAHGNDGGGSIRIPAACCGLVGLKPTRGRLVKSEASQALPVDLIGEGVLTRSVRDTARFFAAAEGYYRNPKLPAIGEVTGPGKRRLKVGLVVDSITGRATDAATRAAVEDTARLLADLGHHVEEAPIPLKPSFIDDFVTYYGMMAFMVRTFGHRLFGPGFDRARLDDLTQGLAGHYRKRMLKTPAVLYRLRRSWREYARAFENYDVVLSPVLAHTTPKLGYLSPTQPFETLIERLIHYASFTPANNASGSPAISLPLGATAEGLPIGVQLAAVQGGERTLLELAYEVEAARPWRRIQDA
ncbi:amidase [Alloalcanivorax profundimaris]|uniref:amidase n=1 Tax=Alloalcanivorax profundimaris TaxID=2735259 RepID=UPI000C5221E5|nr:amidase [Alloalcanivorax profundimaris]MAO58608.1 amidase [Alcanivorax sp.]MCQ6260501.1 amidase [Alcanivorax sp. MM125-6]MAY09460.1 amidase [Alcanivorax sp.]MBF1803135.1 amidase [Alloalcanivorax profundimaris]MBU59348.1 amidase [Alcanivorax sp.]|tara:strand:- start:21595 stop:23025 length:1431 start_codon:yes stop_codon:yes gene_type:complete